MPDKEYRAYGRGQTLEANIRLSRAQEMFWDDWRIECAWYGIPVSTSNEPTFYDYGD